MKTIVIIGYGQLGTELCKRLLASQYHVISVSRSHITNLSDLHKHISANLDELRTALSLPEQVDCLYYFAPPSVAGLSDQRIKSFLALHNYLAIKHLVYISTSGVYGDSKGKWLNEEFPVKPIADRSKRRLDAEQQLTNFCKLHNTKLTILRCAAIYSTDTINIGRIKANTKPVIKASQAPFTNRIHLSDLTEICLQAMLKPPASIEIYNVSDGNPSTTTEHAWLLSDEAGIKRNPEIDISEASQYYSPAYLSYLNESKKLDITKLKNKLKPVFRFDDITNSIRFCLKDINTKPDQSPDPTKK